LIFFTFKVFFVVSFPDESDVISLVPRCKEDLVEVINDNLTLKENFEILYNEVSDVGNPIWIKFIDGTYSEEEYVRRTVGFIRGWSESSILSFLHHNQEACEWFYSQLKERIREKKEVYGIDNIYLIVCLRKKE
jgi:hypothetical protein